MTKGQPAPLRRKLSVENTAPTKLMGYMTHIVGLSAVRANMVVDVKIQAADTVSYQNAVRSEV